STPDRNLEQIMLFLMWEGSRSMNSISSRNNHVIGGPYQRSLIDSGRYYVPALRYVYRNPVKTVNCETPDEYPYSTLHGLIGNSRLPFPLFHPDCGFGLEDRFWELSQLSKWLNRAHSDTQNQAIQRGLRYSRFALSVHPKRRQQISLE